jgi:Cu2+-exporting ATPase
MRLMGRMLVVTAVLSLAAALPVGLFVSHNPTVMAAEELESVHLEIKGMVCGDCQAKVKTALSKLPEVKEANVSWEAGGADVKVTKGSDHKKLVGAVKSAGFDVSGVKCECKA